MPDNHLDLLEIVEKIIIADTELDEILKKNEVVEIIIVGSSAFILKKLLDRTTMDIDTYTIKDERIKAILEDNDINDRCAQIMNICEGFYERLEKVNLNLDHIKLLVLSDYDLVISKMATPRPKDLEDIIQSGLLDSIDFDKLETIIKEEFASPIYERRLWSDFEYLKSLKSR